MTSDPCPNGPLRARGAKMLLGSSILARLPLAMFSIALLVDAQQRTRSFAVAGLVSGAYAVGSAISAPILGGAVDRIGQTTVLVFGSTVTAVILGVDGLLPTGAPHALLIVLGAATGLSTPPVAACVRTLLPAIVAEREQLPALFALESTVLELTFVAGPPLALGLGSIWSPRGALAGSGMVMLAGTLLFAVQPVSVVAPEPPDTTRDQRLPALAGDEGLGRDLDWDRSRLRRDGGRCHRCSSRARKPRRCRAFARSVGIGIAARRSLGHSAKRQRARLQRPHCAANGARAQPQRADPRSGERPGPRTDDHPRRGDDRAHRLAHLRHG